MKIYIIEDEKFLREYMQKFLTLKGFDSDVFVSAEDFLKNTTPHKNDCLIVDVKLPKKSGFDLIDTLNKSFSDLNVIFISAMKNIENIAKGFELGASDYIKKPFELDELVIRINHIYKEHSREDSLVHICDDILFDKNKKEIIYKGQILYLSPVQMRLFELLLINRNKPLSFEYIIEVLWWDRQVSNATLSAHINQIKRKIPCLLFSPKS